MSKKDIKKFQRAVKVNKGELPPADPQEVLALLDLLFETYKGNNAQCARLLGISTPTWKRWAINPPTEWYWPMVLRKLIKHSLSMIVAQRRFTGKKFQANIQRALNAIPQSKELEAEIAELAYDIRGAELHLRTLLAKKGMYWSDIRLPANCGGYTEQMLHIASRALKIVKTQSGYGEEKDSYWRLPTEEEGDD